MILYPVILAKAKSHNGLAADKFRTCDHIANRRNCA